MRAVAGCGRFDARRSGGRRHAFTHSTPASAASTTPSAPPTPATLRASLGPTFAAVLIRAHLARRRELISRRPFDAGRSALLAAIPIPIAIAIAHLPSVTTPSAVAVAIAIATTLTAPLAAIPASTFRVPPT